MNLTPCNLDLTPINLPQPIYPSTKKASKRHGRDLERMDIKYYMLLLLTKRYQNLSNQQPTLYSFLINSYSNIPSFCIPSFYCFPPSDHCCTCTITFPPITSFQNPQNYIMNTSQCEVIIFPIEIKKLLNTCCI